VVKRSVRAEQLLNPQRMLQNTRDYVTFLDATLMGEVANSPDSVTYCTFVDDYILFHSTYRESQICSTMSVIVSLLFLDMFLSLSRCSRYCKGTDPLTHFDKVMYVWLCTLYRSVRSYRYFYYIGNSDVDRTNLHSCDRLPGSSKLHSVFAPDQHDPTKLLVRDLSCFWGPCLQEDFNHCENDVRVREALEGLEDSTSCTRLCSSYSRSRGR